MFRNLLAAGVVCVASMAAVPMTWAHHAGTMYDHASEVSIVGEVKEWRWANPHAFLQIYVSEGGGEPVLWSFESTSPNILVQAGWKRTTLKPGDHVTVTYNPLKDGAPGGSLTGVVLPDGTTLRARAGSGGASSSSE